MVTSDRPFDLFVFDLDGTALGGCEPYARFPDRFSAFLDALAAAGTHWCTNTTWHPRLQLDLLRASRVQSRPAFLYGRTGLMRARAGAGGGEPEYDEDWAREVAGLEGVYLTRELPRVRRFLEVDLRPLGLAVAPVEGEPLMLAVAADEAAWAPLCATVPPFLAERLAGEAYAETNTESRRLVIMPARMSKAAAVRRMHQDLICSPARTLVAGDSTNDLSMLDPAVARFQVCPANAAPAVKERVLRHAGVVGEKPYSDGVIEAVGCLFGRGRNRGGDS